MLAPNENGKSNLYLQWVQQAQERMRVFDEKNGPYRAELVPGSQGRWHVLTIAPSHEKIAAGHLIGRGFGIFLPETGSTEIRRGRKVDLLRLMLPGYLFVFVWDAARNARRILACPGVHGFLMQDDHYAVVPWDLINHLRVEENKTRPLTMMVEVAVPQRRWRNSRKAKTKPEPVTVLREVPVSQEDIVSVHAYSPYLEEMRTAIEPEARISAFHKALGLGS